MKRRFLFCVTFFCLFFVVPTIVYGENIEDSKEPPIGEEIRKSRSGLFGNLKKLDNMLKDKTETIDAVLHETVNSIDKTVTDLSTPPESKPVISRFEDTGTFLNKTVNSTVSNIEKTTDVVTVTVEKTTSEMTNVVNDTVYSAVDELPTIPVVTPVVKKVSKTVTKTTNSVQTLVENTGEFVNETLRPTSDVPKDTDIEPVETAVKVIKPPQKMIELNDEEKTTMENENSDNYHENSSDLDSLPEREPIIPLDPKPGTNKFVKQVRTSGERERHNDIRLDDGIETTVKDEDNFAFDSILGETFLEEQSVVNEIIVIDRAIGLIDPVVNSKTIVLEKKNVDKPNLPTKSSKKRDSIPVANITEASLPAASPTFLSVGKSDLSFWGIVDMFLLQSSIGREWIDCDEEEMVLWIHAPPGKPPKNPLF